MQRRLALLEIRDDRGVGAYLSFVDDRGDFYFAADGLSGNLALTGFQDVPSPRVLRVRRDSDTVDESFMLDLGALLHTPATFGFWPVSDTKFVVQAWASDVDPQTVIPAGERWADGSLRPAVEDWLGAGAIISFLDGKCSPEAALAKTSFLAVQNQLADMLRDCISGVELYEKSHPDDVTLASAFNASSNVPVLREGAYIDSKI